MDDYLYYEMLKSDKISRLYLLEIIDELYWYGNIQSALPFENRSEYCKKVSKKLVCLCRT